MKAVGNHLVLTFCETLPRSQFFTIVLTKKPHNLSRDVSTHRRTVILRFAIKYFLFVIYPFRISNLFVDSLDVEDSTCNQWGKFAKTRRSWWRRWIKVTSLPLRYLRFWLSSWLRNKNKFISLAIFKINKDFGISIHLSVIKTHTISSNVIADFYFWLSIRSIQHSVFFSTLTKSS